MSTMPSRLFLIELKDLRFHSFHGLYPEEKKRGGKFLVDLTVEYPSPVEVANSLNPVTLGDTIDYAELFEICKEAMQQPTELLENVAISISNSIQVQFKKVVRIEIRITKCNPPIPGCTGSSSVKFIWTA